MANLKDGFITPDVEQRTTPVFEYNVHNAMRIERERLMAEADNGFKDPLQHGFVGRMMNAEATSDNLNRVQAMLKYQGERELDFGGSHNPFVWVAELARYASGKALWIGATPEEEAEAIGRLEKAQEKLLMQEEAFDMWQDYAYNTMGSNAFTGWTSRLATSAIEAVMDCLSITDEGDIASAIRVGSFALGAYTAPVGLGQTIAYGVGEGAVEALADVARMTDEGEDPDFNDYMKQVGINFTYNMVGAGVGYGLKKGVGALFGKYKKKGINTIAKGQAEAMQEIVEQGDDIAQPTMKEVLQDATNELTDNVDVGAEKARVHGFDEGKVEAYINPDGTSSKATVNSTLSSSEQIALSETIDETIGREAFDNMTSEERFLFISNNRDTIDAKANRRNADIKDTVKLSLLNRARTYLSLAEEVADKQTRAGKHTTVSEIIGKNITPNSPQIIDDVATIVAPEKLARDKNVLKVQQLLEKWSGGTIKSPAQLFDKISKNNNIVYALLKGRLDNIDGLTPKEVYAFEEFARMARKHVTKTLRETPIFTEEDEIYKQLTKGGDYLYLVDLFEVDEAVTEATGKVTYRFKDGLDLRKMQKRISNGFMLERYSNAETAQDIMDKIVNHTDGITSEKKLVQYIKEKYPDNKELIKHAKREWKEFKNGRVNQNALIKLLKAQEAYENTTMRNVFSYSNKQDLLRLSTLVSTKRNITGTLARSGENFYFESLEQAKEVLSEAQYEDLLKVMADFEACTGKVNPMLEDDFFGVSMNGRRFDMRDTTIGQFYDATRKGTDDLPPIFKESSWEELPREAKVEFIQKYVAPDVQKVQTERVGKIVEDKLGTDATVQDVIDYYSKKYNIKINTIEVDDMRGVAGASIEANADGSWNMYLNKKQFPQMNKHSQFGVLRHEIQHLYESVHTGKLADDEFKTIFKDVPELTDEMIERVAKGDKIYLDELAGAYYNNHFYNTVDDMFETSYANAQASRAYNNMDSFKKFQMFVDAMRQTTKAFKEGRMSDTWVMQAFDTTTKNPEDLFRKTFDEAKLDPTAFFTRRFVSPDDMLKFVTKYAGRATDNYESIWNNTISGLTKEDVGYSVFDIIAGLSDRNIGNFLEEMGFADGAGADSMKAYLKTVRSGLVLASMKNYVPDVDSNSWGQIAQGVFVNSLVGFRAFKDALAGNVSTGMQYINNGEIAKGMQQFLRAYPSAFKAMIKSNAYVLGNLIDSTADVMQYAIQDRLGMTFEGRYMRWFADSLRKAGDIGDAVLNLEQKRIIADSLVEMSELKGNINKHSLKGTIRSHVNKGLFTLQSDDIMSNVMARANAKNEILSMAKATRFQDLTEIQKKMYSYSGFAQDEFPDFMAQIQKYVTGAESLNNIPEDAVFIRSMMNAGITQFDWSTRARISAKGMSNNPFMFMLQTTTAIFTDNLNRFMASTVDGNYFSKVNAGEFAKRAGAVLAMGGIAGAGYAGYEYTKSLVADMIFKQENPLTTMWEDVKEIQSTPTKALRNMADATLSQIAGGSTISTIWGGYGSTMSTTNIAMATKVFKAGKKTIQGKYDASDFALAIGQMYYGVMVGKVFNYFEGDEEKTAQYIGSSKFKKQFRDYTAQHIKADAFNIANGYTTQWQNDGREAVANGMITQDDFLRMNNNITSKASW